MTRLRSPGTASVLVVLLAALLGAASSPASGAERAHRAPEYAPDRLVVQYADAAQPTVVRTSPAQLTRSLRRFQEDPAVVYAERDVVVRADGITPDDPYWDTQWGPQRVQAPDAWSTTTGDPDVVVAVLDTGVADGHEDVRGSTVPGWNVIDATADTSDAHGHGTSAASVIAARGDNGRGLAGMCWRCSIMPVKVLDDEGVGYVSDLAQGIRWATDHGASVVSMSLSADTSTRALDAAVRYATEHDVVLLASAGNHGTTDPVHPAANPDVIGVGASDQRDLPYSFSARGDWVDLAAPGCNVAARASDGGYAQFCGTSSAAPVVAGAVGVALAKAPATGASVIRSALTTTAVDVGSWVRHGRLDANAFVDQLEAAPEPDPESDPEPEPEPEPEASPEPEPGSTVQRLAGDSRFSTAAAISAATASPGVERVYVGTGRKYPDALAAGPAAAAAGGPVLLTEATSVPAATAQELARLRPREIVLTGGTATVSPEVEAALARHAPVRRLAGSDRYATASAVARDAFRGPVPVLYVASGRNFPDALAGGAAAAQEGGPLLLTEPRRLPAATESAIANLRPERIVVLGGTSAVSDGVVTALRQVTGVAVARVSGLNRFATSSQIARWAFPGETEVAYLATGRDFPDALAGGPAAAAGHSPLLLVEPTTLPPATADELARLAPRTVVALGGRAAVSDAVLRAAGEATGR